MAGQDKDFVKNTYENVAESLHFTKTGPSFYCY